MEAAIKILEKIIDIHTYIFTNNEPVLLLFSRISFSCCFRNIHIHIYIYWLLIYFVESFEEKNVSVTDINYIFKFLLALPFAILHICYLSYCHWTLLVISVVCALEYIKYPKTAIASKFCFIEVKFKLFENDYSTLSKHHLTAVIAKNHLLMCWLERK